MHPETDRPEAMERLFKELDRSDISSIKGVVTGIIGLIGDPKSTAKELKELIEIDPPLTARVLFLANSAYYAPRVRILDIMQAIIFVGFNAIKELALSQKVLGIFKDGRATGGYSSAALWRHSLATALFAKMLYRREFRESGENAYVAGLIHDIGIIALQQFLPVAFYDILETAEKEQISLTAAERAALGFDHAALGEAITRHWDFPEEIVMAIGDHHAPGPSASRMTLTLFIADTITRDNQMGYENRPAEKMARYTECLGKFDVSPQAANLILADVKAEIATMEERGLLSYDD